jgi:hypothetical protein
MALPDWESQQACEAGEIPHLHYILYY